MDVKVAESAGFCYGVKRAVDMARETARQGKPCAGRAICAFPRNFPA